MCVCNVGCFSVHTEVRGQFSGITSLLLPCVTQEYSSAHQAGPQVPLPTEPSHLTGSLMIWLEFRAGEGGVADDRPSGLSTLTLPVSIMPLTLSCSFQPAVVTEHQEAPHQQRGKASLWRFALVQQRSQEEDGPLSYKRKSMRGKAQM